MPALNVEMSITAAIKLFDKTGLLVDSNKDVYYPNDYVQQLRGKTYSEQVIKYKENFWFNVMLRDGSLLLFDKNSYRYMMSPVKLPTEDDFVEAIWGNEWEVLTLEQQEGFLQSAEFSNDYEQHIENETVHVPFTPVRLDMSLEENEYCAIKHPAYHLHIGFENQSRIPVKRELTPYAFSAFILSTFYPYEWEAIILSQKITDDEMLKIKESLTVVSHYDNRFWSHEHEEMRLYLG